MPTKKILRKPTSQPPKGISKKTIGLGELNSITISTLLGILALIIIYTLPQRGEIHSIYNSTYPLTIPIKTSSALKFRIGAIADLDENSKSENEKNTWYSYYLKGDLSYDPTTKSIEVNWDQNGPVKLTTSYSLKGRGIELSELVVFDGRLLTFCDRTGIVFEIIDDKVIPWVILMDGNGKTSKGYKSEWATVKDEILYVGSMGKEWTTAGGEFVNNNPQFVKTITTGGQVTHLDWVNEYKRIREVLNIYWPGYMIHESGVWSDIHKRWFFLPRRCSKESYNETLDELRGCSVLITANEGVSDVKKVEIENSRPTRGFSSFRFLPFTGDQVIVALRTEELEGKTSAYITAFTIEGKILLDDIYISNVKYEGFEFI